MATPVFGEISSQIAYFHGHQHIAEAGMTLLEAPSEVQIAVLKGLGTASLFDLAVHPDNSQGVIPTLQTAIPGIRRLDRAVGVWSAQHLPTPYQQHGLYSNGIKEGGISLHYDEADDRHDRPGAVYDGPLSMSLRVDSHHDITRTFYASRTDRPAFTAEGIDKEAERALVQACRTDIRGLNAVVAAVHQEPGDLVIMRNYPYPTLHAVEDPSEIAGEGLTRALLATWRIKHVPAQDTDDVQYLLEDFRW